MKKTDKPARAAQAAQEPQQMPAADAPQAAQTPTPARRKARVADAHHGRGGAYEIVNGKRVLMQRTTGQQQ